MDSRRKKQNIVLFSVVYHASEIYLNDFLNSLEHQTDKDFDIILANDGVRNIDEYTDRFRDLNITSISVDGNPEAIRLLGIRLAADAGYESVVFGDSDDYFDCLRIEMIRAYLQKNEIVFNDIHLVDENGCVIEKNYLSHRFGNRQKLYKEDLIDKNFIGLSNSSVNVRILRNLECPDDLEVFDWYLFSMLHWKGCCSLFTNETATYYRQHSNNCIGMKAIDKDAVIRGVKVKLNHYMQMRKYASLYESLYEGYNQLFVKLMASPSFEYDYCQSIVSRKTDYPLWWEQIGLAERLSDGCDSTPGESCGLEVA